MGRAVVGKPETHGRMHHDLRGVVPTGTLYELFALGRSPVNDTRTTLANTSVCVVVTINLSVWQVRRHTDGGRQTHVGRSVPTCLNCASALSCKTLFACYGVATIGLA